MNTTLPPLYALDAKGKVLIWSIRTVGSAVVTNHGRLDGQYQEARFICKPKNVGRANATTAEEQAVLEAKAKWEKQRKKKYFLTIDEAKNTASRKPMLAQKFDDHKHKLVYPVIVQPKLDGVRCLAYRENGKVVLHSRGGEVYDVKHISGALEPFLGAEEELDGEIYVHGMSLQQIVSLVKRPQEGSLKLQYWVYDMPSKDENYLRDLGRQLWFRKSYVAGLDRKIVVRVTSSDMEEEAGVRALHDEYIKSGFEGAIVRSRDGLYRHGYRSPDLLKLKVFDDGEFEITDWKTGKGAFAGVPIFECAVGLGATFDVAPRGCAEIRADLLVRAPSLIGKKLTVRHFGWTDEGMPRFPVGVCVREEGT